MTETTNVRGVHGVHGVRGLQPRDHDQFFTAPDVARKCIDILQRSLTVKITDFDLVVEPSFGDGAFVSALMASGVDRARLVYVDIDAVDEALRKDFLKSSNTLIPPEFFHVKEASACADAPAEAPASRKRTLGAMNGKTCLTIGNPPFGKNSSKATAFFNKAAEFSSVIAFIVPRTFVKDSIKDRLDRNFFLANQESLEKNSFIFEGNPCTVPCVFQVWIHGSYMSMSDMDIPVLSDGMRPIRPRLGATSDFVFVTAEKDPHIAIRRVGTNAGRIFTDRVNERSIQSHLFIRVTCESRLEEVLARLRSLNLEKTSIKYDTAGCPSIGRSELCALYNHALSTQ